MVILIILGAILIYAICDIIFIGVGIENFIDSIQPMKILLAILTIIVAPIALLYYIVFRPKKIVVALGAAVVMWGIAFFIIGGIGGLIGSFHGSGFFHGCLEAIKALMFMPFSLIMLCLLIKTIQQNVTAYNETHIFTPFLVNAKEKEIFTPSYWEEGVGTVHDVDYILPPMATQIVVSIYIIIMAVFIYTGGYANYFVP
jgi:hypothetical protein